MSYVLGAIVILIWIGIFFGSIILLLDGELFENPLYNLALAITGLIICIASVLWVVSGSEDKPCVRYETSYQYNPSTKTTMPMQFCAQYGEWVKNK